MRNKQTFDHENEGQGHGVQHSQWFRSIENINLYKSHSWVYFAGSHRFKDIHHFRMCDRVKMLVTTKNIRSGAIRWKIRDFLSRGNSNVCIFQHLLVNIVI